MALEVVGAGVGRTGTMSLKAALEQLLGGRCYHMMEVFGRLETDVPVWRAAFAGQPVDWEALFADYTCAVDWPAAGCWREISAAFPDAPVVLSTRSSPEAWWTSASQTIFESMGKPPPDPNMADWYAMAMEMLGRFGGDLQDADKAMAAYERHNAEVRATIPADRLVEWQPGDGWAPLCEALGVPIPEAPFPHLNTTAEFREHLL